VVNNVRMVPLSEIAEKDYNLNIPLYIEKEVKDNLPTMQEALAQLEAAAAEAWKAEDRFKKLLKEFDLLP
jgi:type I restriction enzyme M protein